MRILIVDGDPTPHGGHEWPVVDGDLRLTQCRRGIAVAEVGRAVASGEPYAVAVIDSSAGIDGRALAKRIRALDAEIYVVIVTVPGDGASCGIGPVEAQPDKLLHITGPSETAEVRQAALALGRRWQLDRERAAEHMAMAAEIARLREQAAELAANESRAMHLATHDSLTDAPNRLAFVRALTERAPAPGRFATAMIDLDRFKLVNDTLGHLAGDALIRAICVILHEAAPAGATVARLGGDEFGILFNAADAAAATAACDRMLAACSTSIPVFGHSVRGGASAGIVVLDGGAGCDPADALRRADLALNAAKQTGRGVTRLFDDGMDEGIRFRRGIETGLRQAIAKGELSLVYQPIVGRDAFEVVGFEALLRWDTPAYGAMCPNTFLPIAEESNLIHELGDWVIDRALRQVAAWAGPYVSINFSPRQFRRPDIVDRLVASTRRARVDPARVQVEITEAAIFDDADRAAATLHALRRAGFRIALDDFGTGYSSLYNIRTFALDCLKIDRSFVEGMGRERESAAIVHSIIHLGRALGLGVIAEGVESAAQVQALRIAGASHLQGFYIARPVAPRIAREMVTAGPLRDVSIDRTVAERCVVDG